MKTPTIYDIKYIHLEKFPHSRFFDRKSMKFFGQTLKMFSVVRENNRVFVSAPIYIDGKFAKVYTKREFIPETGELKGGLINQTTY